MNNLPPLPPMPKNMREALERVEGLTPSTLPPIPEPHKREENGELTENEYRFILDAELTKKRRDNPIVLQFIDCFMRCKNINQASDECGIAHSLGYRIRHYKDVSVAMQKLTEKSAIKYGFDASEIMERTKELVDFDPIMLMNPDGTFKSNLHDIKPEARRSLKKMKVKNLYTNEEDINGLKTKIIVGELIEYEFYDKLKAIELSGKEKEMFKNTTVQEHTISKDMKSILLASVDRGKEASKGFIELNSDGERK